MLRVTVTEEPSTKIAWAVCTVMEEAVIKVRVLARTPASQIRPPLSTETLDSVTSAEDTRIPYPTVLVVMTRICSMVTEAFMTRNAAVEKAGGLTTGAVLT